ncbi:MAG: hypothetical protein PHP98_11960 [Kiritimatiellae bacterium]|nr:hypothetical protein [Kiritimatiellia bacterium]
MPEYCTKFAQYSGDNFLRALHQKIRWWQPVAWPAHNPMRREAVGRLPAAKSGRENNRINNLTFQIFLVILLIK